MPQGQQKSEDNLPEQIQTEKLYNKPVNMLGRFEEQVILDGVGGDKEAQKRRHFIQNKEK